MHNNALYMSDAEKILVIIFQNGCKIENRPKNVVIL